MKLRVATRGSPLALVQTHFVIGLFENTQALKNIQAEPVVIQTEGDLKTDTPIAEMGGKAVFASALENAVLEGEADIAVHSAKDLSAVLPEGLAIGAVPERADPRDVLVGVGSLEELPQNALIGTGAARRKIQLQNLRPDLKFFELRGNIETRLNYLKKNENVSSAAGEPKAVIVAKAALDRLGLNPQPSFILETSLMLPQVGQGFLAVQHLEGRSETLELLAAIDDFKSHQILSAERGFLEELEGDCDIPAAAFAEYLPQSQSSPVEIQMEGLLAKNALTDPVLKSAKLKSQQGETPRDLGRRLARGLL